MYKVMIVDDEKFIRKSIRNRIEWGKYGLAVEAEAGNGEEALRLLEEIRPEVILVDIRMPVMDGLAFIEEAKKRLPKSYYVVMSAYNDFSYAKKAIQLGVEDYILKPVEEEELGKILVKITHGLNQAYLVKQVSHAEASPKASPLNCERIAAIAFWMAPGDFSDELEEKLKTNVHRVKEHLEVYCLDNVSRENCYVYLVTGEMLSEEELLGVLKGVIPGIRKEAVAAYTEVYPGKEAKEVAAESVQILKTKMFYPAKQIIHGNGQWNRPAKDRQEAVRDWISRVYHFLLGKEYEKAFQEFMGVIDQVVCRESGIELIEEIISESLLMLRHFPGEKNDSTDFNIKFHRFGSRDYLLEYKNAGELKEDLKDMLNHFAGESFQANKRDVISAIKNYIQENYSEDLNAPHIANKFYLNAGYLSTLFKEKTGIRLVTYIEGIRMENAKKFLKNNIWTITEIAMETGYSDANYFSKVFRRYTGMSPTQYREASMEGRTDQE